MGQQFDQASREHLAADLNASHDLALKLKQVQSFQAQLKLIEQQPEHMQPGLLHRWGLADLAWGQVEQPIEADVIETPEGLVIPAGLMGQPTLEQEISDRASDELAIDWFSEWGKRCGVVCGESGDGKSFLLTNIVLATFIRDHGSEGSVFICDPDYGSSHGDSEPNTWLDLNVGQHIFVEYADCFKTLLGVSKLVEDRVKETRDHTIANKGKSEKTPKPKFPPVLFIMDELPALMAAWTDSEQAEAIVAVRNILRRGLKQNVTFKVGTFLS
jgi:hypothetical protein